jgi:hypothetical protein
MKILPDDIKIENPYAIRPKKTYLSASATYTEGQQSILSQVKKVDIDVVYESYRKYRLTLGAMGGCEIPIPFSQFLQKKMDSSKKSNSSKENLK